MSFNKNDRVIYLPTGETASVTKVVNEDIVYIRMEKDREEIPAMTEDVAPYSPELVVRISEPESVSMQNGDRIPDGLWMFFQYKMSSLSPETPIPVFLANGLKEDVGYDINFFTNVSDPKLLRGKIKANSIDLLHQLAFDQLNDNPQYEIDWSKLTADNKINTADIKIKAAQFFNKFGEMSWMQSQGSLYPISDYQQLIKPAHKSDSLKAYSRAMSQPMKTTTRQPSWEIKAKADFNNVLDLHIEKLLPNQGKISPGEVFKIQLQHFERFIEEALRLGVKQVFVLHGIGKGKLKNEISSRLIMDHRVNIFKNEFHPQYGHGATEIWLY